MKGKKKKEAEKNYINWRIDATGKLHMLKEQINRNNKTVAVRALQTSKELLQILCIEN